MGNKNGVGSGIDDGENESYYSSVGRALSKPCDTCRWWDNEKPTICEAFPSGIPLPIFFGFLDHTTPFGDEDLLYEKSVTKGLTHLLKKKISKSSVEPMDELHPKYPAGTPGGKGGKYMPKGSPEYIEARKKSQERFSAPKYAVGRAVTDISPDEYSKKSKIRRHREAMQIARKILSPEHFKEFNEALSRINQDIADGNYSYKGHLLPESTPQNRVYTQERKALHNSIIAKLLENSGGKTPKNGENPEFVILGGVGGCTSGDHEILTPKGWVEISKYNGEDIVVVDLETSTTFFEKPTNYLIASCNAFYSFKSKNIDLLVSAEHRMPFFKDTTLYTLTASEIYSRYVETNLGFTGSFPYLTAVIPGSMQEVHSELVSTIEKIPTNSYKYCFTTSTGYFLTRRSGCVSVTGNSGKSKFSEGNSKVFDESTHLKLDSDEIKAMLPGYTPEKAGLYHHEAADILAKVLEEAKAKKLNIALDATMSASEKPYIDEIKSRGYNVSVHYMHVSPTEAAGRAVSRWLNHKSDGTPRAKDMEGNSVRGRLVDPSILLGMVNNLHNFDEARKLVKDWSFFRNNVPSGVEPVKVLSSKV